MKKLILALGLFLLSAGTAFAQTPPVNCGNLADGVIRDGTVACDRVLKINADGSINVSGSITASLGAFEIRGNASALIAGVASTRVALATADSSVLIQNSGAQDVFIKFGTSGVTAALTDTRIPAGATYGFAIAAGVTHVAGITASSTSTILATSGAGLPSAALTAAGGGGLTDTQLRASAVPVSLATTPGLTDTQLRASAVPVSGPLTDTQLRATAVTTNASADTHAQCSALCANLVVKGSAGVLKSFEVSADSTLSAAIWYVTVIDATSAPADGAITPIKCYQQPIGQTQMGGTLGPGGTTFATGIVIGVSSTGCFTKTASTHAFIAGDFQ